MSKKQPKRKRLWLNDGSCVRLRSNRRNHVWSYDFAADRTSDGRLKEFPTAIEVTGSKPLPLAKEVSLRLGSRPLSFGTVAAHEGESVRGDEVALWISGGRAGRFKDWLSLLKLGVALR